MGAGCDCPVNRTTLEVVKAADPVRGSRLVGERIAQETSLPTHTGPLVANGAVDFVSANVGRPVNGTVLEVIVAADAIRRAGLICHGETKDAVLPTHRGI